MMSDKDGLEFFGKLIELMARLRAPDGCPWDREQTPESLTPYILEEACELVDAIKEKDPAHVCEELGDLLFQIVFQAQIASEQGEFGIREVVQAVHEKMTRRHPHVFGGLRVENSGQVRDNWARIKAAEGRCENRSALGKVPRSLPSLLRARRLTENAAEVGFDWDRVAEVMDKVDEEWKELKAVIASGDRAETEEEFGDLLFALVNLSRFLSLDPEAALGGAIEKFVRRFSYLERKFLDQGKKLESVSLEEMESFWREAKQKGL